MDSSRIDIAPNALRAPEADRPRTRRKGLLIGGGLLACGVACAAPLLVAGGTLAGVGALAAGYWWVAAILGVAVGALVVMRARTARSRAAAAQATASEDSAGCGDRCTPATADSPGCGCGSH